MTAGGRRELIFEPRDGGGQCHASTLVALPGGEVLAAWFGGSREGAGDVAIRLARRTAGGWSAPETVAAEEGLPHWNPVLFRAPGGAIFLYYKVGPSPSAWWTRELRSDDNGASWRGPRELVPGDRGGRGPVKNKPIALRDGAWLAPASLEGERWDAFADRSADGGETWTASDLVPLDHAAFRGEGVIQPALWESAPGAVHMLLRSTCGRICRADSADGGRSWGPVYATALPNNNSGLDLAALPDGSLVLAHNPVGENWGPRTPLVLSVSRDGGGSWRTLATLEDEQGAEYSYSAVVPLGDGVAVTYTWRRESIAYAEVPAPADR